MDSGKSWKKYPKVYHPIVSNTRPRRYRYPPEPVERLLVPQMIGRSTESQGFVRMPFQCRPVLARRGLILVFVEPVVWIHLFPARSPLRLFSAADVKVQPPRILLGCL